MNRDAPYHYLPEYALAAFLLENIREITILLLDSRNPNNLMTMERFIPLLVNQSPSQLVSETLFELTDSFKCFDLINQLNELLSGYLRFGSRNQGKCVTVQLLVKAHRGGDTRQFHEEINFLQNRKFRELENVYHRMQESPPRNPVEKTVPFISQMNFELNAAAIRSGPRRMFGREPVVETSLSDVQNDFQPLGPSSPYNRPSTSRGSPQRIERRDSRSKSSRVFGVSSRSNWGVSPSSALPRATCYNAPSSSRGYYEPKNRRMYQNEPSNSQPYNQTSRRETSWGTSPPRQSSQKSSRNDSHSPTRKAYYNGTSRSRLGSDPRNRTYTGREPPVGQLYHREVLSPRPSRSSVRPCNNHFDRSISGTDTRCRSQNTNNGLCREVSPILPSPLEYYNEPKSWTDEGEWSPIEAPYFRSHCKPVSPSREECSRRFPSSRFQNNPRSRRESEQKHSPPDLRKNIDAQQESSLSGSRAVPSCGSTGSRFQHNSRIKEETEPTQSSHRSTRGAFPLKAQSPVAAIHWSSDPHFFIASSDRKSTEPMHLNAPSCAPSRPQSLSSSQQSLSYDPSSIYFSAESDGEEQQERRSAIPILSTKLGEVRTPSAQSEQKEVSGTLFQATITESPKESSEYSSMDGGSDREEESNEREMFMLGQKFGSLYIQSRLNAAEDDLSKEFDPTKPPPSFHSVTTFNREAKEFIPRAANPFQPPCDSAQEYVFEICKICDRDMYSNHKVTRCWNCKKWCHAKCHENRAEEEPYCISCGCSLNPEIHKFQPNSDDGSS